MTLIHGTRRLYKLGCRCTACRASNATYWAQWHQQRARGKPPLGSLVNAKQAGAHVRQLLCDGFTKAELARRMGLRKPYDLKLSATTQIRLRTALKVQRVWREQADPVHTRLVSRST